MKTELRLVARETRKNITIDAYVNAGKSMRESAQQMRKSDV